MRADRPLLLLLVGLTAGCADPEPFVDPGPPSFSAHVNKPRDTVVQDGHVKLCYSSATPWSEVETLARERCAAHGLQSALTQIERQQCRATAPHRATFLCYDPEMRHEDGSPVNPFSPAAVAAWEKRTGKTAKPHNFMTVPGGPAPNPAAPPPPVPGTTAAETAPTAPAPIAAPVQPAVTPLTPDAIADRPAHQPDAPRPAAPATAPAQAYPVDNFSLPQGSWGDAFQE